MMTKLEHLNLAMLAIGFAGMLGIYVGCKTPPLPDPIPFPTTTTTTIADETPIDITHAEVHGQYDFRNAQQDSLTLTGIGLTAGTVALTWDKTSYPLWPLVDGSCNGHICYVYKNHSGYVQGGYFDDLPQAVTSYSWGLKHIHEGYPDAVPESGTMVYFFLLSEDCSKRSSLIGAEWSNP